MSGSVECSVVLAQDGVKVCVLTGETRPAAETTRETLSAYCSVLPPYLPVPGIDPLGRISGAFVFPRCLNAGFRVP
jgi:hypothetical protein